MNIPKRMFIHTVSIEETAGAGSFGTVYNKAYSVKCYVQPKQRKLVSPEGQEIVANSQLFMAAATHQPTIGSRVTFEDVVYKVVRIDRYDNPLSKSNPKHHLKLILQ